MIIVEQRKRPLQARSRARVEAILDAAAQLIAEVGLAQVSPRQIAQRAGVSPASLYRYFPNQAAVVRAVAERQLERLEAHLTRFLDDFDLADGLDRLLDSYAEFYRREPGYLEIWSGLAALPELAELDRQDLRRNARRLAVRAANAYPQLEPAELEVAATMLSRACGAVLRLAMTLPEEEAAPLLEETKAMARVYLRDRLGSGG